MRCVRSGEKTAVMTAAYVIGSI